MMLVGIEPPKSNSDSMIRVYPWIVGLGLRWFMLNGI